MFTFNNSPDTTSKWWNHLAILTTGDFKRLLRGHPYKKTIPDTYQDFFFNNLMTWSQRSKPDTTKVLGYQ